MMRYRILDTPTGEFALCEDDDGSLRTGWITGEDDRLIARGRRDESLRPDVCRRLERYFDGEVVDFSDLATPGGEDARGFFARCWEACRTIPRGETRTYAELAAMAGAAPGAARAAGQAMRRNPLPVIIPCHRVLATGGRLGGFAGESDPGARALAIKHWLLELEGVLEPLLPSLSPFVP